jgi:hypothetical protein
MKVVAGIAFSILVSMAVWGCGSSPTPAVPETAIADTTPTDPQNSGPFPIPDFSQPSRLHMIADEAAQVNVGDSDDKFKTAFPRSATKSRSLDGQLPVGAEPPRWSAKGWALDNASRGVGALYYENRIALAMSQFDNVEERDVENESKKYVDEYGEATFLPGKHVRYWFWQRGTVVLMICAFKNKQGEMALITAIGDAGVMSRLNMSPGTALEDQKAVEKLYGPLGETSDAVTKLE